MAFVQMSVDQVLLDPVLNAPVLILKECGGDRAVPIWVGQVEALAIVTEIEKIPMARPMTHDLMKNLVTELKATVQSVAVTELRDGTYYAEILISTEHGPLRIDSRPSDAIALALRAHAPIFVEEQVMAQSKRADLQCEAAQGGGSPRVLLEAGVDEPGGVLEGLQDEDFGKWKM